jgi:hypothetical protein
VRGGVEVALGVFYPVVSADFRPLVCVPFLLFSQALLSVLLKSLHVGNGTGDPKFVFVVELLWFDVVT